MVFTLLAVSMFAATPAKVGAVPADPAAADATARARELFLAAQALYKKGQFEEASTTFEKAYAVKPHPVITYNIGKCHEQLGNLGGALRAFRDYLRLLPEAPDRDAVSDAVANLERRLRERGLQQVLIFATPEDARIVVNGIDLGVSPVSVELSAGTHKLRVSAPGFETVERPLPLSLARASEVTVALSPPKPELPTPPPLPPPLPSPPLVASATPPGDAPVVAPVTPSSKLVPEQVTAAPVPEKKKRRFVTWIALGTAVAGTGAGVGLGVASSSAVSRLRESLHDQAEAQQLADRAKGTALGANIAYGVAGAALITAVVFYVLEAD